MVEKSIPETPSSMQALRNSATSKVGKSSKLGSPSVWVMENTKLDRVGPALALARRLGRSFRRIRQTIHLASAMDDITLGGVPPELVLSSGFVAGLGALHVRSKYGARVIHCGAGSGRFTALAQHTPFDLLVVPRVTQRGRRIVGTLGPMSGVSINLLDQAGAIWADRLSHLPHPRITFLFGGHLSSGTPESVFARARRVASMVRAIGGSIMACVMPGTENEVAEAFAAALSDCFHVLWRHGEPDENPMLGFLGSSDAVVVHRVDQQTLIEACAVQQPVFFLERAGLMSQDAKIFRQLVEADHIRPLEDNFSPWPRTPLDEAGRIAATIRETIPFGRA